MLALEHIKILDLTHLAPGFFCTMMLGDLGADVIKVSAPPQASGKGAGLGAILKAGEDKKTTALDALNRNKRCMGINLRSDKGKEVFLKMAKTADVVVEGFRPGVVKRLGIDYETVRKINPKIVYCSLSGFGQDGPYAQLPGHDINYISIGGVLGMIGRLGGPPVIPLNLIGDFGGASLHGVIGIMAALIARQTTGKGQYVDISYTDGAISLHTFFLSHYLSFGVVPKLGASVLNGSYPYYDAYKTKDGKYLSIGCMEPWFWENLLKVLGKEEYIPYQLTAEHMLKEPNDSKWGEIRKYLEQTFLTKTRDEWFDLLIKHDVPVGKVYSLDEVPNDPQVKHREMVIEIDDPEVGRVKQAGMAIKLSETPCKVRRLAPTFGEHTDEILKEYGYTKAQIEELRQTQAIG